MTGRQRVSRAGAEQVDIFVLKSGLGKETEKAKKPGMARLARSCSRFHRCKSGETALISLGSWLCKKYANLALETLLQYFI